MACSPLAIVYPLAPWHFDHHFQGRIILPAVAMMELLARTAREAWPDRPCTTIENAQFRKFIEIPAGATSLNLQVELTGTAERISARLLSRQTFTSLSRMICHCRLDFVAVSGDNDQLEEGMEPEGPTVLAVPAERIYRELVPFGPSLHSLQGDLRLTDRFAWGRLRAAEPTIAAAGLLGSPFPCDGAMHAACVHGQRLVDFVPFPVAIGVRRIHRPTCPGGSYTCRAELCAQTSDTLSYTLIIGDEQGRICETITGLEMADVSGGRVKPPPWLKAGG